MVTGAGVTSSNDSVPGNVPALGTEDWKPPTDAVAGRQPNDKAIGRVPIKPVKYDGKGPLDTFLTKFESTAVYNGWNEVDKMYQLIAILEGDAEQVVRACQALSTYAELCQFLRQNYGTSEQQDRYQQLLRCHRQKSTETLRDLARDIQNLAILAIRRCRWTSESRILTCQSF